jgi:hypothetical protein
MTAGAYPLTAVGNLPNVTVAYPGDVWSDRRANGNIVPGAAVFPVNVGGKLYYKQIVDADIIAAGDGDRVAVAMRQVEIPDVNSGPTEMGPNEIVNQMIASGDYLRTYHTGVLHLTLVEPRADYVPGQRIGWAPLAVRPAGKAAGTGAWSNTGFEANTDIFETWGPVWRPYGASNEGILTVRFIRGIG